MFKSDGKNMAYNHVLPFLQKHLDGKKNCSVKLNCFTAFYFFRLIEGEAFEIELFSTTKPRVKNMLTIYFKEHA